MGRIGLWERKLPDGRQSNRRDNAEQRNETPEAENCRWRHVDVGSAPLKQLTLNQRVPGSSPGAPTNPCKVLRRFRIRTDLSVGRVGNFRLFSVLVDSRLVNNWRDGCELQQRLSHSRRRGAFSHAEVLAPSERLH